jgi:hypothetical protein
VRPVTVETLRLFLHILAATIWVGGQITLAALIPALRAAGTDVPKAAANAFNRVAWPAFGILVLTGIWNVEAEGDKGVAYQHTLLLKYTLVVSSGFTAYMHAQSPRARQWQSSARSLGSPRWPRCLPGSCSPNDSPNGPDVGKGLPSRRTSTDPSGLSQWSDAISNGKHDLAIELVAIARHRFQSIQSSRQRASTDASNGMNDGATLLNPRATQCGRAQLKPASRRPSSCSAATYTLG